MDLAKTYSSEENKSPESEDFSDIMIHGYTSMGSVVGFGSVQVESRELVIPERNAISQFVRFELTTSGDYPQNAIETLPYDKIDKIITAISKLRQVSINRERFEFTEVQFEVGNVKITVFNNDRGDLMWAFSISGTSAHFNKLRKLDDLKMLIEHAKAHLDKTKI